MISLFESNELKSRIFVVRQGLHLSHVTHLQSSISISLLNNGLEITASSFPCRVVIQCMYSMPFGLCLSILARKREFLHHFWCCYPLIFFLFSLGCQSIKHIKWNIGVFGFDLELNPPQLLYTLTTSYGIIKVK